MHIHYSSCPLTILDRVASWESTESRAGVQQTFIADVPCVCLKLQLVENNNLSIGLWKIRHWTAFEFTHSCMALYRRIKPTLFPLGRWIASRERVFVQEGHAAEGTRAGATLILLHLGVGLEMSSQIRAVRKCAIAVGA